MPGSHCLRDQSSDRPSTSSARRLAQSPSDAAKAFDQFQGCVAVAEDIARRYGHLGFCPDHADAWDHEFESAYLAIEPFLQPLKQPRTFYLPHFLPGRLSFLADNAHQALMFVLNPPEALFGSIRVLASPDYLAIKRDVQREMRRLKFDRTMPSSKPMALADADEVRLMSVLLSHHSASNPAGTANEPLGQKELVKMLGWSQSKVSRTVKKKFGGMGQYYAWFSSTLRRGLILSPTGDSTGDHYVDGIFCDEPMES